MRLSARGRQSYDSVRRQVLALTIVFSLLIALFPLQRFITVIPTAEAAAFTSGNLVIYRVGTGGAATLSNAATAVFLDEYTTSGGTPVQSIALPTTATTTG